MKNRNFLYSSLLILIPIYASAHGFGNMNPIRAEIFLGISGIIWGACFLLFLLLSRKYTIKHLSAVIHWAALVLFSTVLADRLNNLLWDMIYRGNYYLFISRFILLAYPAVWIPSLKYFKMGIEPKRRWRAALRIGMLLAALLLISLIAETVI